MLFNQHKKENLFKKFSQGAQLCKIDFLRRRSSLYRNKVWFVSLSLLRLGWAMRLVLEPRHSRLGFTGSGLHRFLRLLRPTETIFFFFFFLLRCFLFSGLSITLSSVDVTNSSSISKTFFTATIWSSSLLLGIASVPCSRFSSSFSWLSFFLCSFIHLLTTSTFDCWSFKIEFWMCNKMVMFDEDK